MSEWKDVRLGELARGIRGVSYRPYQLENTITDTSVVLLRANNIQNRLVFEDIQIVPDSIVDASQILERFDIAVCMSNGSKALVGKSALYAKPLPYKVTVGAFCSVFHPLLKNDNYVFYLFQSNEYQKQVDTSTAGSAINNLRNNEIEAYTFKVPTSIIEQRKIAQILSTVDAVIERTEGVIAKYKAIKRGMMHDLFTRGLDENGRLRPRCMDAPDLYKQSKLGWVPKEWEVVTIGQVSTLVTNGFVGTATPFYAASDDGVLYLYGTNIRPNEITLDDVRFVNRSFHQRQVKSQLQPGDMLTVQSGHVGTTAVVPPGFAEANCHALIITRLIAAEMFPWFASQYLNSDMGMKGLERLFIGSTVKHINTSEFAEHTIIKPNTDEQKAIAQRIASAERMLRNEQQRLRKSAYLKQALLSDLLTGRVPVKVEEMAEAE